MLHCFACGVSHPEDKFHRDKNRKKRGGRKHRCKMSISETRPRQIGKYDPAHFQAVEKQRRAERRTKRSPRA
jgi:hypothetical protein